MVNLSSVDRVRFWLLVGLAFLFCPVMAQSEDLDVSITPVENGVEFVLTNNGQTPISLLRWETPLESELTQDVFYVTQSDGGNRSVHAKGATFSGRLFKRASPQASDFIDIAPGQSISSVVSIADYYQLSLIHISEPTRQAEISYAVFCLKKKK